MNKNTYNNEIPREMYLREKESKMENKEKKTYMYFVGS